MLDHDLRIECRRLALELRLVARNAPQVAVRPGRRAASVLIGVDLANAVAATLETVVDTRGEEPEGGRS